VAWERGRYLCGLLLEDTHDNREEVVDEEGDKPVRETGVEMNVQ
jgi:hypothetical protein